MEKQTIFRKVKTSDRLPEETGYYYVWCKGNYDRNMDLFHWYDNPADPKRRNKIWVEEVEYWLEEIELPDDEEVHSETNMLSIQSKGITLGDEIDMMNLELLRTGFKIGVNWFKSKLINC